MKEQNELDLEIDTKYTNWLVLPAEECGVVPNKVCDEDWVIQVGKGTEEMTHTRDRAIDIVEASAETGEVVEVYDEDGNVEKEYTI
jgi:hypothetical protein